MDSSSESPPLLPNVLILLTRPDKLLRSARDSIARRFSKITRVTSGIMSQPYESQRCLLDSVALIIKSIITSCGVPSFLLIERDPSPQLAFTSGTSNTSTRYRGQSFVLLLPEIYYAIAQHWCFSPYSLFHLNLKIVHAITAHKIDFTLVNLDISLHRLDVIRTSSIVWHFISLDS